MSLDSYSDCSSSDGQESPTEIYHEPFTRELENRTQQEKDTYDLVVSYVGYRLRTKFQQCRLRGLPREYLVPPSKPSAKALKLRTLAINLEGQHDPLFQQICLKIDLSEHRATENFRKIAQEIFTTGVNWGRIVSLITFVGVVADYYIEQEQPEMVSVVVQLLCEFMRVHLAGWITENDGWVCEMLHLKLDC